MRILPTPLVAPEQEPVSLGEACQDARIDSEAYDPMLPGYIAAARAMCEHETGRKLVTQTWRVEFDAWPNADELIRLSPVQSAAVTYWDGSSWVPLSTSAFVVLHNEFNSGVCIVPSSLAVWPALPDRVGPRVRVDVVCGYGAPADVPENLKRWIRAHVVSIVRNPEASTDRAQVVMPYLSSLLDQHRAWGV